MSGILTRISAIKKDLKDSMEKSMNMARLALKGLTADADDNIKELRGWFFRDEDLETVKNTYEYIQHYGTFGEGATDKALSLTIYCDLSRMIEKTEVTKEGKEDKFLHDIKNNVIRNRTPAYEGCKDGDTIAYTTSFWKKGTEFMFTQLCPWYLNELGHSQFKNVDGLLPDRTGRRRYDPSQAPTKEHPKADILASRLDFLLTHELTHALPEGQETDDPAYEWHPCIALGQSEGCMNAESYAFFALGAYLIKENECKINRKGEIVNLDGSPKQDRGMVMKLWEA
ncbi:uncharacterized protein BDV14DRAFT_195825 [Aspergillus stella-maris]|uniref:uncharacterized protein n=1 Tax=Aspergillus stella-maris TaxID=1810926 RepID=UPI003CCCB9D4